MTQQSVKELSFIHKAQDGYNRPAPNPSAFVKMPKSVMQAIGIRTHMGARLEGAVLSAFCYYGKQYAGGERPLRTHNGYVPVPEGQFVLSALRVAENLYYRWFGTIDTGDFGKFYRRVNHSVSRLEKDGWIRREGRVNESYGGLQGTFWSMGDRVSVQETPDSPSPNVLAPQYSYWDAEPGDLVSPADIVGWHFIADNPQMYTHAELCASKRDRGRFHPYINWMRAVADAGASGDRYTSVGAFRPEAAGEHDPSSLIPFVTFDIDGDSPAESFSTAYGAVMNLMESGFRDYEVIVSYTGGRGFHIRIPSGVFGNPIFAGSSAATAVLQKLADLVIDYEVDKCVFRPGQLIRMIGSKHPDSGLYSNGWYASEFLAMSFGDVMTASVTYSKFFVPNPLEFEPNPDAVIALVEASDLAETSVIPDFDDVPEMDDFGGAGRAVERAMQGVTEGEDWHERHMGRNKAMFIVSCHLVRNGTNPMAELREVNTRNSPPLPESELRTVMRSAERTVAKGDKR